MMLSELHQDMVWHRRDGRPVALAEMDAGYCRNVIRMLERTAPSIQLKYTMAELTALTRPIPTMIGEDLDGTPVLASRRDWTSLMPGGGMPQDAFNRKLGQQARHASPLSGLVHDRMTRDANGPEGRLPLVGGLATLTADQCQRSGPNEVAPYYSPHVGPRWLR